MAKMNDVRLLGPSGFPELLNQVQKFKVKGVKGEELKDLKKVMRLYQLWCHQMYPRTNLKDTLKMVEKLCHKRSVHSALRQYREEYKLATQPEEKPTNADNDATNIIPDGQEFDATHGLSSPGSTSQNRNRRTMADGDQLFAEFEKTNRNDDEEEEEEVEEDDWDEAAFAAMAENEQRVLDDLEASSLDKTGLAAAAVQANGNEEDGKSTTTTTTIAPTTTPTVTKEAEEQDIPDDLDEEDWNDDEAEAAMREFD